MAKLIGLVGTGRGKVGNFVLSKGEDGQTIARAYQPQVRNPKTKEQVAHRAKVNAAGRFSALWPKTAITPIGLTPRKNRSIFNKKLINGSKINEAGDIATIIPELVEFSKSARRNPIAYLNVSQNEAGDAVNVEISTAEGSGDIVVRLYLCRIPTETSDKSPYGMFVDVMVAATDAARVQTVSIPVQGTRSGELDIEDRFHVWAVCYEVQDAVSRNRYNQLYSSKQEGNAGEQFVVNADVVSLISGEGAWTKTRYAGSITTPIIPGP